MAYVLFAELDIEAQVELLHKALRQLQSRFNEHSHSMSGAAQIPLCQGEVDLDGIYDQD